MKMWKLCNKLGMTAVVLSAVVLLAGCVESPDYDDSNYYEGSEYRQYNGHDVRYDPRLGVYLVVGSPDHYYWHNHFYRYQNDRWWYSRTGERNWHRYRGHSLPRGLTGKYHHDDDDRRHQRRSRHDD